MDKFKDRYPTGTQLSEIFQIIYAFVRRVRETSHWHKDIAESIQAQIKQITWDNIRANQADAEDAIVNLAIIAGQCVILMGDIIRESEVYSKVSQYGDRKIGDVFPTIEDDPAKVTKYSVWKDAKNSTVVGSIIKGKRKSK